MDKNLHHIENLFKSALENDEEMPSEKVWDAIDNRLDKENAASSKKKYKTWKRLSLLLLILLVSLSIYELTGRYDNNKTAKTNIADKEILPGNKDSTGMQNMASDESRPDDKIQIRQNSIKSQNRKQINNTISVDRKNFAMFNQPSLFVSQSGKGSKIKKTIPDDNKQRQLVDSDPEAINSSGLVRRSFSVLTVERTEETKKNLLDTKIHLLTDSKLYSIINTKTIAPSQANNKKTKLSRFSVSGFFSPDIASYQLDDEDGVNQPDNSDLIKKTERHEFSSTSGLLLDYELNKKWTLQSGLTFSNTNIAIEPKTIYAQTDNNGEVKYRFNISSGYGYIVPTFQPSPAVGDSLKITAATHKLRYIGIPVAVKYSVTNGKLVIEAMSGVSANFLTMGKLETEIQKGPHNEIDILNDIEGLKRIYLSGFVGISTEYKLIGKISFVLIPTARFALAPINKRAVVKTYPNSFGLATGLKIKF